MSTGSIAARSRRAGKSPWVERLGRAGLVAKGALYVVVGILAINVALGAREESPDKGGALRTIAEQPFGKALLVLLALGLGGYAIWQLALAILDRENEGEDAKGLAKRATALAKAAWYGVLCGLTVSVLVGNGSGNENEQAENSRCLRPPGRPLPRLRGGTRLPRGRGVQRLPRGHVQVQREAEAGGDEPGRGECRDRSGHSRTPCPVHRLRADRGLSLQSGLGVRLEGGERT